MRVPWQSSVSVASPSPLSRMYKSSMSQISHSVASRISIRHPSLFSENAQLSCLSRPWNAVYPRRRDLVVVSRQGGNGKPLYAVHRQGSDCGEADCNRLAWASTLDGGYLYEGSGQSRIRLVFTQITAFGCLEVVRVAWIASGLTKAALEGS